MQAVRRLHAMVLVQWHVKRSRDEMSPHPFPRYRVVQLYSPDLPRNVVAGRSDLESLIIFFCLISPRLSPFILSHNHAGQYNLAYSFLLMEPLIKSGSNRLLVKISWFKE